jgi:hypothetical protein
MNPLHFDVADCQILVWRYKVPIPDLETLGFYLDSNAVAVKY